MSPKNVSRGRHGDKVTNNAYCDHHQGMMLRWWPNLGLTQPYYKYLWRCWLLVGLILLQRISYGQMEEILRLRGGGQGSGGGGGGSGHHGHHQQQHLQQLDEQEHHFSSASSNEIECPSFVDNSACPCYKFEDGEFFYEDF